ncbi:amidohydrolase [Zafaria sp. Z1313]|uniref:amidohydrolase n=1 Tax=Zafaria sp. Z1313 TaxID=3423202 RepID=UPI003D303056
MTTATAALTLTEAERADQHAFYRHLHPHPELSMQEHATAALIEERLEALGIEHFRCGGTGVVGIVRNGNGNGPVVAYRADTDGLPIAEDTGLDYASTATGLLPDGSEVPVMHGCGHDTHVATAFGALTVLLRRREDWAGTLVLVFQPGEETGAGAAAMVADSLWDKAPRPGIVLGQHLMPLASGRVAYSSGNTMAMADSLRVTLFGRQSHGSQPQDSIDPIVMGAHLVTRLQTIVSRELGPLTPAVVTVGTFHAGLKENIIPERAELTLNIRTAGEEARSRVLEAVERIVAAEAAASGAPKPLVEPISRFPRRYNDPAETTRVAAALGRALGEDQVQPQLMGSEDVGRLADAIGVPLVYWFFGGFDQAAGPLPVNHSPHFGPELGPALETGTTAAAAVLLEYLGR